MPSRPSNYTKIGILIESANDNIIANPGGGQTNATRLNTEVSRITVVSTSGDSVMLPISANGLDVMVINHGANSVQVFGYGTDTINDVAAATGVPQMAGSMCIYTCASAGAWYTNSLGSGYAGALPTTSYSNGLTAHAGGGQGAATPLTTTMNRVTTVATAADSVVLPASAPGLQIVVANAAAANSLNVFPATGDSIDALAVNTARAVAANKTCTFYCFNAGQWHSLISA